jgi:GntR family transcriptional regulator
MVKKMIVLDYSDTRPIYEQIVDKFQTYILKGVLKPDTQLMSVRNLAMELSINPNTIQKAYAELERQGFIYTIKGRGNFVRYDRRLLEIKKRELIEKIKDILAEAEELNISKEELLSEAGQKATEGDLGND